MNFIYRLINKVKKKNIYMFNFETKNIYRQTTNGADIETENIGLY